MRRWAACRGLRRRRLHKLPRRGLLRERGLLGRALLSWRVRRVRSTLCGPDDLPANPTENSWRHHCSPERLREAKLLHGPNLVLCPTRACAVLARNAQRRAPFHEQRFVLGALLGTNWRRERLAKVLLSWLLLCPRTEGTPGLASGPSQAKASEIHPASPAAPSTRTGSEG